ncbi:hypothetical protein BH11BAC7_BH11BAC7_24440 [soil metagenome]
MSFSSYLFNLFIEPMKTNIYLRTFLFAAMFFIAGMVRAQVIVVATAATTGPTVYPDLTSAFAAINAGTHQGAIGVSIMANSVEAAPCVLNSSGAGPALYTSVNIIPGADNITLSAATTTGRGVIELKGADNVTIDGDNPNTAGINRNLTIQNTAANTITYTSCIRIATAANVTSADNIIISNCILTGNASGRNLSGVSSTTGSENTTFGIYAGGNGGATSIDAPTAISSVTSNTSVNGTTINTLLINNNAISACARGIAFNGANATVSTGVTISNNTIGGAGVLTTYPFTTPATTVYTKGVWINGTNAVSITGNTIQNILSYVGTTLTGVELAGAIGSGTINISNNILNGVTNNGTSSATKGILISNAGGSYTISGNTVSTIQNNSSASQSGIEVNTSAASGLIEKNIVSGVYARSTAGYGAFGIQLSAGNSVTVQNNFIYDLNAVDNNSATSTLGAMGIRISAGTNHKVYYNSVNLYGPALPGGASAEPSACLIVTSTSVTGLDVSNNVFQNTRTGSFAGSANVCIDLPSGMTSSANYTINNNMYYSPVGTNFYVAILSSGTTYTTANFNPAVITPATNWRSYTSALNAAGTNDNASAASSAAAPFTGNTNLHINIVAVNANDLDGKGIVIPSITTDIDLDPRSATSPDIGGDEFALPLCAGAAGGTISPSTQTTCAGTTISMTSTGATTGTGITYQWMIATTSGGPYSNVVGGSGANTLTYTTASLVAGTYYYVLQVTCSTGPVTGLSTELAVTVNPSPTVSVTPSISAICLPGGSPVTLTASGSSATYAWLPAATLTPATGAVVSANPTVTTTYTVTATNAGCTSTATTTVTVGNNPVLSAVTATPASVCSGGNSQLQATGFTPAQLNAYTFSTSTGTTLDPMTGATSVLSSGDDDTPTAAPAAIGFTFNFNGTAYTQYSVSPDGWILLGATVASGEFTNAVTSTTNIPKIYPYWDDMATGTTGDVKTLVTGTAPNRIFIVQWFVTIPRNTTGPANSTFQAWLYEGTGAVEFRYGTMGIPTSGSISSGMTGGATNFQSITFSANTSSIATANDANSTAPASGRMYRFAPPVVNYTWSPGTFLNSTTIANPLASGITSTITYTTTATTALGCTATGTVTITAGSPLTSAATITPGNSVCTGTNITLNAVPTGGGGPYTYSWTGPNSFTSTLQNPTITPAVVASSGTYSVMITDACAATSTATVALTVNPLPTVAVTPTTGTICNPGGSPVVLTATGASTYAWSPTTALTPSTGSPVSANPASSTTYTVTGTDVNGCTATATAVITVAAAPTLTATATPASVCSGGSSQLLANAVVPVTSYAVTSIPYTPTTGTGASILSGDDAMSAAVPIPFTFTYFGTAYTNLFACTNGFIQLGTNSSTTTTYGASIPTAANPNTIIAGVWSDLNIVTPANIYSYVTGIAPNRVLTVAYENAQFYDFNFTPAVSGNINFQVQLFETSNNVEVHVGNVTGVSTTTNNKTLGIENATGTAGASPAGHNFANWNAAVSEGWRFTPDNGTYTYAWTPVTFLSASNISNPMATNVTATTTYSVTATATTGCTATASVTLNAGATLTSSSSTTTPTVCEGTNVTLNGTPVGGGSPYTYSWTGPNSFTSTVQNPVLNSVVVANTGSYILTVTDACSATSTSTVTLTVNPLPVVAVTPTTALYCAPGAPITLTATGAASYTWGPAAGLSATTGASVDATPSASTTYTVTGTTTGCSATATTVITASSNPVGVTATSSVPAICVGGSVNLNGAPASGLMTVLTQNFNSIGTWTVVNGSTSPAASAFSSRTAPYSYVGGSISFTNFSTPNGGDFYMTDADIGGSGSTTDTKLVSPVFSTVGLTTATLTFEHVYQKWSSGDITVALEISTDGGTTWSILKDYLPLGSQGTVTTNAQVAANESINLSAYLGQPTLAIRYNYVSTWGYFWIVDNIVVSGNSNYTYSWTSSPVGFTSTVQNPTGVMPAATTTYSITVSNTAGCSSTASTSVTVNPLPTVTANTTATTVCAGNPVTLTGGGATTYTWTSSVTDNVAFTPTVTDTYTVTGTDGNGCMNTDNITVAVNALPVVVANSTATAVCDGSPVTLSGSGATTYTWTGSVTDNVAFTPAATDTYTVTGTDANGCMNTDNVTVTVNTLPTVVANATATTVCANTPVTLSGSGATTYTWTSSVTDNVAFNPTVTDTYTVTGTDGNGCMNTDNITVTVNPLPVVTVSFPMDTVCYNSGNVTLMGESPAGGTWSGTGVSGSAFDPQVGGLGWDMINYSFTDGNGCTGSLTDSLNVDICNGIIPQATVSNVTIYPNPNEGQFTIQLPSVPQGTVKVELTNSLGQLIDSFIMTSTSKEINISTLESGVYFVRVMEGNNISVHRVVKQ